MTKTTTTTTTTTTKIRCTLTNDPNKTIHNNTTSKSTTNQNQQEVKEKVKTRITWLEEEPGKKSSFYLDLSSDNDKDDAKDEAKHLNGNEFNSISIIKPSHVILECFHTTNNNNNNKNNKNKKDGTFHSSTKAVQWLFGGMEIQSNARNIELYASTTDMHTENNDGTKEEYWHTSRGTKVESDSNQTSATATTATEWYRTILLPPSSKPTMVTRIHLKLLSLRPSKCCTAQISVLKVKGRLFPPDTSCTAASPLTSAVVVSKQGPPPNRQQFHQPSRVHPPPTTTTTTTTTAATATNGSIQEAELGKALSTMALVVQTTKSQIVSQMESLHAQTKEMMILDQRRTLERLDKMEMEMKKMMDWKRNRNGNTVGNGDGNDDGNDDGNALIRTALDPCLHNDDKNDDDFGEKQSKKKKKKREEEERMIPASISASALESLLEEQRKSIVKELLDGQRCMIRDVVMEVLQSNGAKMMMMTTSENDPSTSLENDENAVIDSHGDSNNDDDDDDDDDNDEDNDETTMEQMVQNEKSKENTSTEMANITPSLQMVDNDSAIIDTDPNIKSSPTVMHDIAQMEPKAIMTPRKSIEAIAFPNQDHSFNNNNSSNNNNNNNNNALLSRNKDDKQQNSIDSKTVKSRGSNSDPLSMPSTSSLNTLSLQETVVRESLQMNEVVDGNDATVRMDTRKDTNTSTTMTENAILSMCNQDRISLERDVSSDVQDIDDHSDGDGVGLDDDPNSNSLSNDTTTRSSIHNEKVKEYVANQESIHTISQTNNVTKESCTVTSDDIQPPLSDLGDPTETEAETSARGSPSLEHMLDGIMDTVREQVRTLLQSTLDQHYHTRPNDLGMDTRPIVVEDGDLLSLGVDEGDLLTFT